MNVWRQALFNERAFLEAWRQQVDAHEAAVLEELRQENARLRTKKAERDEDRQLDAADALRFEGLEVVGFGMYALRMPTEDE